MCGLVPVQHRRCVPPRTAPGFGLILSQLLLTRRLGLPNRKIGMYAKETVLYHFLLSGPVRLILLTDNAFVLKTFWRLNHWLDLHETENIDEGLRFYYLQHREDFCSFSFSEK